MSLIGKNTLSLRKKDVKEQKTIGVGFKKIQFAHKAALGDSGITLTSLTIPTEMSGIGFTQPSTAELVGANLLFFRKNLTLISSIKGVLVDQLSYTVASSTRINFNGWTAEDGEIFIGIIDAVAKTELRAVDATAIVSTGLLTVGNTDYNVGTPFEVNKYPLTQVGAVLVFRNGQQQFRNTGNTSTPDGNYYEVQAGSGLGTIIRFNNAAAGVDDNILVVSNGLLAERPDGSMMAVIESLAGQVDAMIPTLAAVAGVPETDFQAAPNNVDLKAFGDNVLSILDAQIPFNTAWSAYTPTITGFGTVSNVSFLWRRNGENLEVKGSFTTGTLQAALMSWTLPNSLQIDPAKTSLNNTTGAAGPIVGNIGGSGAATALGFILSATGTSTSLVYAGSNSGTTTITTPSNGNIGPIANTNVASVMFSVPIQGWAATQTLREQLGL